jgi:hypothetical protein
MVMSDFSRTAVERWLQALAAGDTAAAGNALAPDVELHGLGPIVHGRSSVDFVLTSFAAAFPDLHLDADVLAADESSAIARFTAHGTQQTALFGLPPEHARELNGVARFSVDATGITAVSVFVDGGQLVAQLGIKRAAAATTNGEKPAPSGSWVDKTTREFGERARSVVSSGQEYIRDLASDLKTRLDAPTRVEFEELTRKVDRLAALIEATASAALPGDTGVSHSTGESISS